MVIKAAEKDIEKFRKVLITCLQIQTIFIAPSVEIFSFNGCKFAKKITIFFHQIQVFATNS